MESSQCIRKRAFRYRMVPPLNCRTTVANEPCNVTLQAQTIAKAGNPRKFGDNRRCLITVVREVHRCIQGLQMPKFGG